MRAGTLRELIESYDDDAEVFIAYQPSWPLAAKLQSVTSLAELDIDAADVEELHHGDKPDAVWLVAGDAPYDDPYAPGALFESW